MRKEYVLGIFALVVLGGFFLYQSRDALMRNFFSPTESTITTNTQPVQGGVSDTETVVDRLAIPWELVFLPDGDMLVSERSGRLLRIGADREVIEIDGVAHRGEGGLLGVALHPNFSENRWVYVYLTTAENGGLVNRAERYTLDGATLSERTIIIEGIPGATYHDGGRIAFGPDDMLYITTGDAGNEALAQDTESLAGKILRVHDDGSVPADSPFGNAVYSYGHRNAQGLAWDDRGNLWATEHGRSGIRSGYDEIDKIERGGNYGWPEIQGDESRAGMISPQLHSGPSETWAPAGAAYLDGRLIFAGLRGESLYVADIQSGSARNLEAYLREEYGRFRAITIGPDGMLYVLTSNQDGRGTPRSGDDKIIRIDPILLNK